MSSSFSMSSNASGSSAASGASSLQVAEICFVVAIVNRSRSSHLLQSSALPSPSRDSVMSRASTQLSSSSSTQPLASQPTMAWLTPEKPKREGKSILELNSKPIDYTLTEVQQSVLPRDTAYQCHT